MSTAGTTTKPVELQKTAMAWCVLSLTTEKYLGKANASHISDRDSASFVQNTQPGEAT